MACEGQGNFQEEGNMSEFRKYKVVITRFGVFMLGRLKCIQ